MKEKLDRLELLKQATIVNDSELIDFNQEKDIYDALLNKLFDGELDYLYSAQTIKDLGDADKRKLFELARKYKNLLFYSGIFGFWADSVSGVLPDDYELICICLFDNYDFLLSLIRDGGEKVLEFLSKFISKIPDNSVIEYLRIHFNNDDLLKSKLLDMINDNSTYKGLTDEEKIVLFIYPNNVLVKDNNGITADELLKNIGIVIGKKDIISFEDLHRLISSVNQFEEVIKRVYLKNN